jgi:hypothetical protein
MFEVVLGKQCIPFKSNSKSNLRSCVHCYNESHASSQCPKLYCRVCKIYGHSATLCIKKASTKFVLDEDTSLHVAEFCRGHLKKNISTK